VWPLGKAERNLSTLVHIIQGPSENRARFSTKQQNNDNQELSRQAERGGVGVVGFFEVDLY